MFLENYFAKVRSDLTQNYITNVAYRLYWFYSVLKLLAYLLQKVRISGLDQEKHW